MGYTEYIWMCVFGGLVSQISFRRSFSLVRYSPQIQTDLFSYMYVQCTHEIKMVMMMTIVKEEKEDGKMRLEVQVNEWFK